MPSTYSPSLRLELMGAGDQAGNWGSTTNTNIGSLLEQAITGVGSISMSPSSATTLAIGTGTVDQARNAVLVLSGSLTASRDLIVPQVNKFYAVRNATTGSPSGFPIVVKTATGSGVTLANGLTQLMYCDGTNNVVVAATPPFDSTNGNLLLSGNITINKANPSVTLTKTATTGQTNTITGQANGLTRWEVILGDGENEAGSNAGSNLLIKNSNDAGTIIETPLAINRSTGTTTLKTLAVTGDSTFTGNATVTGALVPSSSFLRNRIINGQQQVDQRNNGASVSIPSSGGVYVTDRTIVGNNGPNSIAAQRSVGALGFQNAITIAGSASNIAASWIHRIEANNCFDMAGVSVTFSAYVWATSNRTVTPVVSTPNSFENFSAQTAGGSATWNVTTTPTRFSWTFTMPANAVNGAQILIEISSLFFAQSVSITGTQLELGTVATPFERRLFGQELSLCQRYYNKTYHVTYTPTASTPISGMIYYPYMRVQPVTTWVPAASTYNVFSFNVDFVRQSSARSVMVSDIAGAGEWSGDVISDAEL